MLSSPWSRTTTATTTTVCSDKQHCVLVLFCNIHAAADCNDVCKCSCRLTQQPADALVRLAVTNRR